MQRANCKSDDTRYYIQITYAINAILAHLTKLPIMPLRQLLLKVSSRWQVILAPQLFKLNTQPNWLVLLNNTCQS